MSIYTLAALVFIAVLLSILITATLPCAPSPPYWSSFGYEWTRHPRTQLDGPGQQESERTFREKTGLAPADVFGKRVLDVGCGAGRFLEVVSRWGAAEAIGLEPSAAVSNAWTNLRTLPNVGFVNCALADYEQRFATFRPNRYDLVYCLGVLHHTPDPAASFRAMARLVKPGGLLCVWLYGPQGSWARVASLYRRLTVHLPWWLLHGLCHLAGPWHYVRRIPLIGPWLWRLFPCSTHPNWRWRVLDTFDWYSPRYQSFHTEAEVTAWFTAAGFTEIEVLPFPVSVRGRRPCAGSSAS